MKFALVLLSLVSAASAFMAPNLVAKPTTLEAVSNLRPQNDWSDKPLLEKRSTTPVPKRKVNAFQRQMMKDVIIPPDFTLTWAVAALGPLIISYHPCKY
jgi:hypothetical protein